MKRISLSILAAIAILTIIPVQAARADFVEDTDDTFTIVWLADTQDMAYHRYGGAMAEMGKWIADNRERLDIRYVVQTGDAVDNGAATKQWQEFETMYDQFKDDIPYIGVAGNHEVKKNGYLEYSARPEVLAIPQTNRYTNAQAMYQTFKADGIEFIIVAIGYEPDQNVIPWVNKMLQAHKDRVAIIIVHDYLQTEGRYGINGKAIFEQVVAPNPNVRIVLCGHVAGVGSRIDEIDDTGDGVPDRTVTQLRYNYQKADYKCGQLRTMQFNTVEHSITVTTYSPVTNRYYRDYTFGDHTTFTLENAF